MRAFRFALIPVPGNPFRSNSFSSFVLVPRPRPGRWNRSHTKIKSYARRPIFAAHTSFKSASSNNNNNNNIENQINCVWLCGVFHWLIFFPFHLHSCPSNKNVCDHWILFSDIRASERASVCVCALSWSAFVLFCSGIFVMLLPCVYIFPSVFFRAYVECRKESLRWPGNYWTLPSFLFGRSVASHPLRWTLAYINGARITGQSKRAVFVAVPHTLPSEATLTGTGNSSHISHCVNVDDFCLPGRALGMCDLRALSIARTMLSWRDLSD